VAVRRCCACLLGLFIPGFLPLVSPDSNFQRYNSLASPSVLLPESIAMFSLIGRYPLRCPIHITAVSSNVEQ